ncbi:MAG: NAD-dependent epimerase/dehydratase family protein [Rhodobacteraceae bacterium]|nr:MAG: NAD-dependent epimerase/dehydratase family protein [Paracoccaceae bacterium]
MAETILVTGGNGNLGRLVAGLLERDGARVVSFDLPGTPRDAARHATVEGDIRDTDLLRRTIETHRPDAVLHLASLLSGSSEADPALAWEVNATASFNLMQAACDLVPGPFVFASTITTYGPGLPDPLPLDAPQWPQNLYGATKVAVERAGVYLKHKRGLDFRCLRFPQVLSPFAPPGAVTAYPSHAFRAAAEGRGFTFPVSPDTGMSNLYLDDVVASLAAILRADRARLRHPAYNMHGFFVSAGQIARTLSDLVPGFRADFAPDPAIDALIRAWPDRMDSSAARADWDWAPAFDFPATARALLDRLRGA